MKYMKYTTITIQTVVAAYVFYKLGKYAKNENTNNNNNGNNQSTKLKKPKIRRKLSIFQTMNNVQTKKENPFQYEGKEVTLTQRAVLSIGSVTLLPLRVLLFLSALVSANICSNICIFGISNKDLQAKPLPTWRRTLLYYTLRPCIRVVLFSLGFIYIEEDGLENINNPCRGGIVISNHVSFIEPFYYMYKFMAAPIAAGEHLKIPLLGTVVKAIQTITVNRKDPKSKSNVIQSMKDRAQENSGWPQILIFPEGTCTNGKLLITFKSGAFIPAAPIQPCVITYPRSSGIFGYDLPVNPSWVHGGLSQLEIIFRVLSNPFTRLQVQFLPVIQPLNDSEIAEKQVDRKSAANAARKYGHRVRNAMCNALGVHASSHSVEDVWLQKEALDNHMPANAGVVEFKKVERMFHVNIATIKKFQERFAKMDKDKNGTVSLEEFISIYTSTSDDGDNNNNNNNNNNVHQPELESLFHLLDENDDGEIDFQEYLVGLALLCKSNNTGGRNDNRLSNINDNDDDLHDDKILRLAFRILDKSGNDRVDVEDIFNFLKRQNVHVDRNEFNQLVAKASQRKSLINGLDWDMFVNLASSKSLYNKALHHIVPLSSMNSEEQADEKVAKEMKKKKKKKKEKKTLKLNFHDIKRSDISKLLKLVEDAYYDGDIHFIDYDKESIDNFINNVGPKKYTRTSEDDILQMIQNKDGTLFCAKIDTSTTTNNNKKKKNYDDDGEIVGCAFVEKCNLQYAKLNGSKNPCKLGYVCTSLNYQNLGLGEKIMRKALEIAHEKKHDEVIISVIDHKDWLKQWYNKKFGFKHYKNLIEPWPAPVGCFVRDEYKESTKFALMRMKLDG